MSETTTTSQWAVLPQDREALTRYHRVVTVTPAATVWSSDDTSWTGQVLSAEQALANGLDVLSGWVAVNLRWADDPFFIFLRPTGRTRRFFGLDCPTFAMFLVDTVAREQGDTFALWGVPGRQEVGTWATRPENVS